VTSPHSDDHVFMQKAISKIQGKKGNITLIHPNYNAAETKWIVSRMTLFAGARTHSTIAALSSGIPTLSFAYSIKSQGINRDIFGHTDFCIEPTSLNAGAVSDRIVSMLNETTAIRSDLGSRIPGVQKMAMSAGMGLKRLIEVN